MMISVPDAKKILLEHAGFTKPVIMPLSEAAGYVLAEDIYSPLDMPAFAQSAMDGYALHFESLQREQPLPVRHVIQAGASELPGLKAGEAMRIFTGAPLPPGADTVVMQEKVEVREGAILIKDPDLKQGLNVRPIASQTAKGARVAPAGTLLGPGSIGLLAGLGLTSAKVYAAPSVGILVTGKELVKPGKPLHMGQVYESNSVSLRAALAQGGISPTLVQQVDDAPDLVFEAIKQALTNCQLLLITGGISVGDYDFVHAALEKAGVETLFYKVKQKPGKPLYCGKKGDTLVFGLPGNPGSVLSCFYQYVVPAIRQMKGLGQAAESPVWKYLNNEFSKKPGLTNFLKARYKGDSVQLLQGQESYKLSAFVESNCLVELAEEKSDFRQGDRVRVYPFNQLWA